MIHIAADWTCGVAPCHSKWGRDIDQIDQAVACAKLDEAEFVQSALDGTTQYVSIEGDRSF
jgi:hypothetical protein